MSIDRSTKIQRSVDTLERLFSVVVGLAITVAVHKIVFDKNGNCNVLYDSVNKTFPFLKILADRLPVMLAFIFLIVPFYQGMNRHLDQTYVEQDVPATKEGFLVIDFFVFFIEACFLVSLASLVGSGDCAFLVLSALLVFDAVWAFTTHGIHYGKIKPSTITWGWINITTVAVLLLFYFSQIFPIGGVRSWALSIVIILRTVVDYKLCWRFYIPSE